MNERVELIFTFTDVFNDFALQHDVAGIGFTALDQNFLETQVATLALRYRSEPGLQSTARLKAAPRAARMVLT